MSDTNGSQQKEKATKVRHKPERESVLQHTFSAVRHSTDSSLWDRDQQGSGLLQRQCACGTHTIGGGECDTCRQNRGSSFLQWTAIIELPNTPLVNDPAETHTFPKSSHSYGFSKIPAHTTPPSKPIIQPELTVNAPGDQYEQEADAVMRMLLPSKPPVFDGPTLPASPSIPKLPSTAQLKEMGNVPLVSPSMENRIGQQQRATEVQRKEVSSHEKGTVERENLQENEQSQMMIGNAKRSEHTPPKSTIKQSSLIQLRKVQASDLNHILRRFERMVKNYATQTITSGTYAHYGGYPWARQAKIRIMGSKEFVLNTNYFGFQLTYYDPPRQKVVVDRNNKSYVLDATTFLMLFGVIFPQRYQTTMGLIDRQTPQEIQAPGRLSNHQQIQIRHSIDTIRLLPNWVSYASNLQNMLNAGKIFSGRLQAGNVNSTTFGITNSKIIAIDFSQFSEDWRECQIGELGLPAILVHEYDHIKKGLFTFHSTVFATQRRFSKELSRLFLAIARKTSREGRPNKTIGSWSTRYQGRNYTFHHQGTRKNFVTSP